MPSKPKVKNLNSFQRTIWSAVFANRLSEQVYSSANKANLVSQAMEFANHVIEQMDYNKMTDYPYLDEATLLVLQQINGLDE